MIKTVIDYDKLDTWSKAADLTSEELVELSLLMNCLVLEGREAIIDYILESYPNKHSSTIFLLCLLRVTFGIKRYLKHWHTLLVFTKNLLDSRQEDSKAILIGLI